MWEQVCKLATRVPFVKDFGFIWYRDRLWQTNPPFLAWDAEGELVGFCAAVFNRNRYVYLRFIGVDPARQHQGIGHAMLNAMLAAAAWQGMTRLKHTCHMPNANGMAFWHGLGFKPRATDAGFEYFDTDIAGVGSVAALKERLTLPHDVMPPRELAALQKKGVTFCDATL